MNTHKVNYYKESIQDMAKKCQMLLWCINKNSAQIDTIFKDHGYNIDSGLRFIAGDTDKILRYIDNNLYSVRDYAEYMANYIRE